MNDILKLSARLTGIASAVTLHQRLCDVGCDHAHIPIRLIGDGVIESAIAMDVIPGPLEKARENLSLYHCEDLVELRQSDGLDAFRAGEAQTLVIAGMGGRIMSRILMREPDKTRSFGEWILQPQADPDFVRRAIRDLGWHIDREQMILEEGKYYPIIHAAPGSAETEETLWNDGIDAQTAREVEDLFGPDLLRRRDPVLRQFIQWQLGVTDRILVGIQRANAGEAAVQRRTEVEHMHLLLTHASAIYTT